MNREKLVKAGLVFVTCSALLMGCANTQGTDEVPVTIGTEAEEVISGTLTDNYADATEIILSDEQITVDGAPAVTDVASSVYVANDIVYYEEGKDFTYGEGTEEDAHSKAEADEHTVVHITQPGRYILSGNLSAGQIAVDLGEGAKENPDAVVTLILNNVDIRCSVAPAVIFYNVYECGSTEEEQATSKVDTAAAGANVIIADGTINNVAGSYVARIYESVELSEDGTEVVDSKKLHKYDGAFYSKMSMNVNGGTHGTGVLNIAAENEGLDAELHLTLNGGYVNITSGNDGINTNEDGISVTTINGGNLNIVVDGTTGEGDGIDSNGWLVINGGIVTASACATSGDAGIDSDMGIHINGGTVIATGNMLDHISESKQNYAVMSFTSRQVGGETYTIKDEEDMVFAELTAVNDFTYLIVSTPELIEGTYSVWQGENQFSGVASDGTMGGFGMPSAGDMPSAGGTPTAGDTPAVGGMGGRPEDMEFPENMQPGERPQRGEMPEDMELPENMELPEDMEMPDGMQRPDSMPNADNALFEELSTEFAIVSGGNYFNNVSLVESAKNE